MPLGLCTGSTHICGKRHRVAVPRSSEHTDRIWKAVTLGPFAMLSFTVTFDAEGRGVTTKGARMANIRFRRADP